MSRGLKVALVVVAITLFCCCVTGLGGTLLGTRLFGRAIITNPDRVQMVGSQIAEYDVPSGYAEMFASYAWFATYLDNLAKVTPQDVQRVARQYFQPSSRVIGIYQPKGSEA